MSLRLLRLGLLSLAAWAAPAAAVDISAEAGIVSDYRYRGFSLSNGKPAAQASVTVEHDSGAYMSLWSSTIDEPGFAAELEIDLIGGYAVDLSDGFSLDLSATYYVYPSEQDSNYVEGTAAIERSRGPTTFKAGFSFVPKQRATLGEDGRKHRNSYLFTGASYELEKLPLTLSAQLGYERGIFDEVEKGGKWDWCLDASYKIDRFRVGLAYSGSDAGPDAFVGSLFVDL